jgi:hypothetical protein
LGDLEALAQVYQKDPRKLRKLIGVQKLKFPDNQPKPSKILEKAIPEFQKIAAAKELGRTINLNFSKNCSTSFQFFLGRVLKLVQENHQREEAHKL